MLQAIIRRGQVFPEEVPGPYFSDNSILIQVLYSCISTGTEMTSVNQTKKSLISTALEKPDKVLKYLKKIKTDGLYKTFSEIKNFKELGSPTGYSIAGRIIAVGKNIKNFAVGELVAAAGGGYAYHAEFVEVPKNLVVKIPQDINLIYASSVAIGSIALHGVRRADLKIGEFAVVYGVGLIGLIIVQLLKISGIRVIAIDLDNRRLELANEFGADLIIKKDEENIIEKVLSFTNGNGADAVIFSAATNESQPLSESFRMSKRKGKVVLVGVVGMQINREDMYEKEIDFIISTSYGPGRYDKNYEEDGIDYPYAYVRWTENKNMAEYCRLISQGLIKLDKLLYKIYPIEKVNEAYNDINTVTPKPLMIILSYQAQELNKRYDFKLDLSSIKNSKIKVALIGIGSFAQNIHIPNLLKLEDKYQIAALVDKKGFQAKELAKKLNVPLAATDIDEIIDEDNIDLFIICTRHNDHGSLVLKLLNAGKNVFVEKPLCTTIEELNEIKKFFENKHNDSVPFLMVGYNRRFSKYIREFKEVVTNRINPMMIYYRMNSGFIPMDSWVHKDGGRIVGEACHIVDLMNYLTGSKIHSIGFDKIIPKTERYFSDDNVSITLRYQDGSVCVINYFAVGNNELSKEYMELHFDGKSLILDDYKRSFGYGIKLKGLNSSYSDKGHFEELSFVYDSIKSNIFPIELWDLFQTSEITLNIK